MEHNFNERDLNYMAEHPNARANEIGSIPPYRLQYVRDGKVNVKPEEVKDESKTESV